jgi:glycine cleavage system H protein
MTLPADIRFVQSHEYTVPGPDGVMVGISKYAAEQLGDVVFVELPQVGRKLAKGESFGVVESVKAVSDLYAPVDGEVVAVNEALAAEPGLVGEDPYVRGWVVKIRPSDASQVGGPGTMDAAAYETFVGGL